VSIALRASAIVSSAISKAVFGSGIGFLIFLALKSQFALEALILGGLVSGLIAWSGMRRGLCTGLISGILSSEIDSSYYVPLFGMAEGVVLGIESILLTSIPITIVMVICGALGGIPSSPTAFYLIPGRGE